mmetsp:Transcript_34971/g.104305  ORF Transcript_34971/g.104305 Transcript_34971/m.104305 type:complete len:440 (+) Transcript_34971:57-1376(+)
MYVYLSAFSSFPIYVSTRGDIGIIGRLMGWCEGKKRQSRASHGYHVVRGALVPVFFSVLFSRGRAVPIRGRGDAGILRAVPDTPPREVRAEGARLEFVAAAYPDEPRIRSEGAAPPRSRRWAAVVEIRCTPPVEATRSFPEKVHVVVVVVVVTVVSAAARAPPEGEAVRVGVDAPQIGRRRHRPHRHRRPQRSHAAADGRPADAEARSSAEEDVLLFFRPVVVPSAVVVVVIDIDVVDVHASSTSLFYIGSPLADRRTDAHIRSERRRRPPAPALAHQVPLRHVMESGGLLVAVARRLLVVQRAFVVVIIVVVVVGIVVRVPPALVPREGPFPAHPPQRFQSSPPRGSRWRRRRSTRRRQQLLASASRVHPASLDVGVRSFVLHPRHPRRHGEDVPRIPPLLDLAEPPTVPLREVAVTGGGGGVLLPAPAVAPRGFSSS